MLAELTPEQWTRIRRAHAQASILEAAERGPEAFAFALSALAGPDATVMTFTDSPPDAAPPMPQARGRGDEANGRSVRSAFSLSLPVIASAVPLRLVGCDPWCLSISAWLTFLVVVA